eukprot:165468-Prymnesium_polylepis.1
MVGYVMHRLVRPYSFDFQNRIEEFLFACSAILVLLVALFTLFDAKVRSRPSTRTPVDGLTHY